MSTGPNWWEGKRGNDFTCGYVNPEWANSALGLEALRLGQTLFEGEIDGVVVQPVEELISAFKTMGLREVVRHQPWRGDTDQYCHLVRHDTMVGIWFGDGDIHVKVLSTDSEFHTASQQLLEAAIGPKASAGRVYVLVTTEDGPKLTSIGTASVPLERGNYNPEVLEDFDAVVHDLKSQDPGGRLAIFDGVAGSGKTYLIRGLLAAVQDALFVLVPVNLISELSSPSMINALLETRRNKGNLPTVFLVEDADECLGSRDSTNVNAVSALLNLGDGIIGSLMDIRLVCTTNLKNEELDAAVIRPGRLSRKVHVGPLRREVAEQLYQKLTGKVQTLADRDLTLAQVYSLARDDGWKPVQVKRAMGFSRDETHTDFLKDLGLTSY